MLFGDPPPTKADLHFRLLGIPVRVSPMFWGIAFLLHFHPQGVEPGDMLVWVAAVFISVVVHEMGHALMARRFGHQPWITLHGMGGHAAYNSAHDRTSTRVKIILAGPGAGFLFAGILILVAATVGQSVSFTLGLPPVMVEWFPRLPAYGNLFFFYLLDVNILWGIFNLLPVYPLDGGQFSREMFVHYDPWDGLRKSLLVSFMCALLVAIWALTREAWFMTLMMGLLAYESFNMLQGTHGRDRRSRW